MGLVNHQVLTHWETVTNFMGLRPIPRFRAYLGASTRLLGASAAAPPHIHKEQGQTVRFLLS